MSIMRNYNVIVGCFDPTPLMTTNQQQFVPGQNLTFPVMNTTQVSIECKTNHSWLYRQRIHNISCVNGKWTFMPSPCISMKSFTSYFDLVYSVYID